MTYKLHLFRVFRIKYDRLSKLIDSDNVDDSLEISAILRHFLKDGNKLADDVANELGLQCSFPLTDDYKSIGDKVFSISYEPLGNAETFYNKNDFLHLFCFDNDNLKLTVSELIELLANCGGGVHHDGKHSLQNPNMLLLLESDFSNECLDSIKAVSKSVLKGLENLRAAINKEFTFLEQRKRKRQPTLLFGETINSVINFEGDSYLESYSSLDLNKGSVLFSFIPSKSENEYPKTILEIGNRSEGLRFSVQRIKQTELSIRFYMNKESFEAAAIPCFELETNLLFINYSKSGEKLTVKFRLDCGKNSNVSEFDTTCSNTNLEGKVILGQNLYGKNGATFQSDCTLILWPSDYDLSELDNMKKLSPLKELISNKWIETDDKQVESTNVTKIYNQAK